MIIIHRPPARTSANIEDRELFKNSKQLLAVNYCFIALYLRSLRGSFLGTPLIQLETQNMPALSIYHLPFHYVQS